MHVGASRHYRLLVSHYRLAQGSPHNDLEDYPIEKQHDRKIDIDMALVQCAEVDVFSGGHSE